MTIQEYKEKIIHTIELMEAEHKVRIETIEIDRLNALWRDSDGKIVNGEKLNFKMVVK